MVLVYLMGIADLLAAFMLLAGIRIELLLIFTIVILLIKSVSSFYGHVNLMLYAFGIIDLVSIIALLQPSIIESFLTVIGIIMLFKGIISFLQIELFRENSVGILHYFYKKTKRQFK